MNYKASIITIYGQDASNIAAVKSLLSGKPRIVFECFENTFYVGTETREEAKLLRNDIQALNINYSFFHLGIPTGSSFKSQGIGDDEVKHINHILFED